MGEGKMGVGLGKAGTTRICICQPLTPMLVPPRLQACNPAAVDNPQKWCSHTWPGFGEGKGQEPRETGPAGQAAASPTDKLSQRLQWGPDPPLPSRSHSGYCSTVTIQIFQRFLLRQTPTRIFSGENRTLGNIV